MKRYIIFVSRIFFYFLLFSIFLVIIISINIKSKILKSEISKKEYIVDTLRIHFVHGSIKNDDCIYKKERLGGYLGGHVEIEIDDCVYGFINDSLPINFVPKKNYNSKFEKRTIDNWLEFTKYDKKSTFLIPIDRNQKISLRKILNNYEVACPKDYAFFGHRCTSLTAIILSNSNVFTKFSDFESIVTFFYPRNLRFLLKQYAEINNLEVIENEGISCQNWES